MHTVHVQMFSVLKKTERVESQCIRKSYVGLANVSSAFALSRLSSDKHPNNCKTVQKCRRHRNSILRTFTRTFTTRLSLSSKPRRMCSSLTNNKSASSKVLVSGLNPNSCNCSVSVELVDSEHLFLCCEEKFCFNLQSGKLIEHCSKVALV